MVQGLLISGIGLLQVVLHKVAVPESAPNFAVFLADVQSSLEEFDSLAEAGERGKSQSDRVSSKLSDSSFLHLAEIISRSRDGSDLSKGAFGFGVVSESVLVRAFRSFRVVHLFREIACFPG